MWHIAQINTADSDKKRQTGMEFEQGYAPRATSITVTEYTQSPFTAKTNCLFKQSMHMDNPH